MFIWDFKIIVGDRNRWHYFRKNKMKTVESETFFTACLLSPRFIDSLFLSTILGFAKLEWWMNSRDRPLQFNRALQYINLKLTQTSSKRIWNKNDIPQKFRNYFNYFELIYGLSWIVHNSLSIILIPPCIT